MSCGVGCGHSSESALPWLWHRWAAVVPTWPLAWEPPYATGMALKSEKKKKKKKGKKRKRKRWTFREARTPFLSFKPNPKPANPQNQQVWTKKEKKKKKKKGKKRKCLRWTFRQARSPFLHLTPTPQQLPRSWTQESRLQFVSALRLLPRTHLEL